MTTFVVGLDGSAEAMEALATAIHLGTLGSVASRLVHHSPISVLVAKR